MLAPGHEAAALVCLLDRDVSHESCRCGAVPVVLSWLEEDAVTRADHLDRPALALADAYAFRNPDRLTLRVGVPGRACAGREVDACGADLRAARRRGNRVDEHGSG